MATIVPVEGKRGKRYQVRYRAPDGRSRRKHFDRLQSARDFVASVEDARRRGTYVEDRHGRQTLEAWWGEWWPTCVGLRPSSRARDEVYWRCHIRPAFGDVALARIEHQQVRAWLARLTTPKPDGAGLAPASAAKALQVLRKCLAGAVRARRIPHDPTEGITPPKVEHQEMRFLDPDEIATLADAIDPRYRSFVLVGAYGGLRLGELAALRRHRVDLLRRGVDVVETLVEVRGHHAVNPPKTKAGRRWVPLPRFVVDELDGHVAGIEGDGLVFPSPDGHYMRQSAFRRRVWLPALKRADLGHLRIHDLRHTAVSLWIATGADPKQITTWAGHRSVVTLFDRYGHLLRREHDDVTDRLDALARAARAAPSADVVELRRNG